MLSSWTLVSLIALTAAATTGGKTECSADYGKALAESREDGQPLVVVLDVPSDPAQSLDPSLLSADSGAFPLASYDLCHVDVSTEYGKEVAEVFHATSFPHVAIIDRTGSVILTRLSGKVSEGSWRETLARHEKGLRRGAATHTVAKPVVDSAATPAAYSLPAEVYQAQPHCPSCQLRNQH